VNRRRTARLMAEINVVPYIDVMLVLLVIFMITAPLITQGVKIELPQAPAEVIPPQPQEPVIVTVDRDGKIFVDFGGEPDVPVDMDTLAARIVALRKYQAGIPVYVRGDQAVDYGAVVRVMTVLQSAGVESVGLLTDPITE
jgi:biopolymer transport protein TolR